MGLTKTHYFMLRNFLPGEFISSISILRDKFGEYPYADMSKPINVHSFNKLIEANEFFCYYIEDMPDITNFKEKSITVNIKFKSTVLNISAIDYQDTSFFLVRIEADVVADYMALYDECLNTLLLKEIPNPFTSSNDSRDSDFGQRIELLEKRITTIENRIDNVYDKITCFISYRFTSKTKNSINELTRFLHLLDVDVTTGNRYEPRRISDKVQQRLRETYDFFIYVVSSEGDSTWMKQELGMAFMKELPIVILVDDSVTFEPGILGDWEYIPYHTEHIGDSFLPVIEALRYIKQNKSAIITNEPIEV